MVYVRGYVQFAREVQVRDMVQAWVFRAPFRGLRGLKRGGALVAAVQYHVRWVGGEGLLWWNPLGRGDVAG